MPTEIPLSRGLSALVDDVDAPALRAYGSWHASDQKGMHYAVRTVRQDGAQRTVRMHTFLTGWPFVDHINGNTLDNRRANLRPATPAENARNAAPWTGHEWKGVRRRRSGLWQARITRDRHLISLGTRPSAAGAARLYDRAALELHGEFARLNFPREDYL